MTLTFKKIYQRAKDNKQNIIAVLIVAIIMLLVIFLISRLIAKYQSENFKMIDPLKNIINIPTGLYSISNNMGFVKSDSVTGIPQLTTNLITHKGTAGGVPFSDKWIFKKVTDGIYLIRKPRENMIGAECLYTGTDNTVKGYIVNDPKICAMETLDYKNQLDPYSIRLYYKLQKGPDNKVVIQSLQNNMYMTFDGNSLMLSPQISEMSYFTISK